MVGLDPKMLRVIAPILGRVLIVDAAPAASRLLAELLQNLGAGQVWTARTNEQALALAAEGDPQVIFTELAEGVDGLAFTRRIRRGQLPCRKAPVIMVTAQATPASILAARDAGVHEFLRKPYTIKDLVRRLEIVAVKPRAWVEAAAYVGPDRRRFNSGEYKGARRRRIDADAERAKALLIG